MRKYSMRVSASFLLLALLTGCAATSDRYPSLAIRDVERAQGHFTPVPGPVQMPEIPAVPVPVDGDLATQLTQIDRRAEQSHQAFLAGVPSASRLASRASGAKIGSDAWASAQIALAGLDSARSDTAIALADLDTVQIARTIASEDAGAVDQIRDKILTLISQEDAKLAQLRGLMR